MQLSFDMVFPGWWWVILRCVRRSSVQFGSYSEGAYEGMAEVNEVKLSCLAPEASGVVQELEHNVIMEEESQE